MRVERSGFKEQGQARQIMMLMSMKGKAVFVKPGKEIVYPCDSAVPMIL
jgi:hypothetical protein